MYDIILKSSIKNFNANRREPLGSVHVVIMDQAGFHMQGENPGIPATVVEVNAIAKTSSLLSK